MIKQKTKEPVTMRTKQFKAESKKLLDMMILKILLRSVLTRDERNNLRI